MTQAISSMIYHINTGDALPALSCKIVSFEEGARIHPVVKIGDAKLNELRLFTYLLQTETLESPGSNLK